ncbi:MAG TPA: gluconate 2-dehydrogenase subunit 3 family protein [Candidatus Eisenbacteria bacterium]|nr:gluconate 2-dehydrogenase subunit 3 family protein [Candidatus Eisenbacteria bacterium]
MDSTRRTFLAQAAASLGLLYLSGLTPELLAQAHEHAKTAPRNLEGQPFRYFTAQQAADYEAFASQIIPTDETPGAKEANVVRFVDFALSEIEPQNKTDFANALKALNEQARKTAPQEASFAALTSAQQVETMKAMEKSGDFSILKNYTLIGFFGDPADGGNKDQIGWKLIGFEDKFYYAPPFGYYDAQAMKERA